MYGMPTVFWKYVLILKDWHVLILFVYRIFSLSVLGSDFQKYMDAFKPFLGIGLKNYAEYQVQYGGGALFLYA